MENFEFDKEMQEELSEIGAETNAYYEVSVEPERAAVVMDFYEKYCDMVGFGDEMSVENILTVPTHDPILENGINEELVARLDMELNDLIDAHPILTSGVMRVRGDGLYVFEDTPEGLVADTGEGERLLAADFLAGGALVGEVGAYYVEDAIPYESYLAAMRPSNNYVDEQPLGFSDLPGVWLKMKNVTVFDVDGTVTDTHDAISVPFNYPSLTFAKPEMQSTAQPEKKQNSSSAFATINYFSGASMLDAYRQIIDDLHQANDNLEDLQALYEECQEELEARMAHVDRYRPYILSASEARTLDGEMSQLDEVVAIYVKPHIMHTDAEWQVKHSFRIMSESDERVVYIAPEHLTAMLEIYEP